MLKSIIRKHTHYLVDYATRLEQEQVALIKKVQNLEGELKALKETFELIKSTVSDHRKSKDVGLKQKWLNGYPDDTVIKGE